MINMARWKCRKLSGPWVQCDSKTYKAQATVFESPSKYGINNGRISKLWVQRKSDKKEILNYDRGWDIKPKNVRSFIKPFLDYRKTKR